MSDLDKLEKAADLKKKGVITDKEFQKMKKTILSEYSNDEIKSSGKMVPMGEAYISFWKKSFVWKDRATRAEYWWPQLVNFLIGFILGFLGGFLGGLGSEAGATILGIFSMVFSIVSIFPGFAVLVRRFHDLGKSAIVAFVPLFVLLSGIAFTFIFAPLGILISIAFFVIAVIWLVFLCLPGQKGKNKYGLAK